MVKEHGERKRPYQIPITIGRNGKKPIAITEVTEKLKLNSTDPDLLAHNHDLVLRALALNNKFKRLREARKNYDFDEAERIEAEMIEIARTRKPSDDR